MGCLKNVYNINSVAGVFVLTIIRANGRAAVLDGSDNRITALSRLLPIPTARLGSKAVGREQLLSASGP